MGNYEYGSLTNDRDEKSGLLLSNSQLCCTVHDEHERYEEAEEGENVPDTDQHEAQIFEEGDVDHFSQDVAGRPGQAATALVEKSEKN